MYFPSISVKIDLTAERLVEVLTVCFVTTLKMFMPPSLIQEKWLVKQCKCNGKAADKNCRHTEIHLPGKLGAGERNCRKLQKDVQELDCSVRAMASRGVLCKTARY